MHVNWKVQVQYIEFYLYFLYIDIAVILLNIFSNIFIATVPVYFVGTTNCSTSFNFAFKLLLVSVDINEDLWAVNLCASELRLL